jgi:phage shock protein PspC (stress-responsive transcriptional regulator)
MSPFVVRLLFVLSCLLPGPQFVIYLALWIIMPRRPV